MSTTQNDETESQFLGFIKRSEKAWSRTSLTTGTFSARVELRKGQWILFSLLEHETNLAWFEDLITREGHEVIAPTVISLDGENQKVPSSDKVAPLEVLSEEKSWKLFVGVEDHTEVELAWTLRRDRPRRRPAEFADAEIRQWRTWSREG